MLRLGKITNQEFTMHALQIKLIMMFIWSAYQFHLGELKIHGETDGENTDSLDLLWEINVEFVKKQDLELETDH